MKKILILLLLIQIFVNLIGALGPEVGFDALWYHLTEAKLFKQQGSIKPIPGNLLYWSGLPRLGEIIYMFFPGKLVHWFFGVSCALLLYRFSGVVSALLFYSLLLVGWLSTSAYIDLIVTAWLLAAVYSKNLKRIIFIILACATKLHALVYSFVISLFPWGVIGILPFALINLKTTGNLFYPFGQGFGFETEWFFNGFWFWLSRPLRLFFDPSFRVGPIILLVYLLNRNFQPQTLLALLLWFIFPGTDFGRFALFPLALMAKDSQKLTKLTFILVVFQALIGISGRAYANAKYLPVILGQQTQADFLSRNLKFHFGDFYDVDGYFAKNIKPTDKVLIYNIHNLYYVNFPFDHESWKNPQTNYTHILVGNNNSLPGLPLIYQNPLTRVKLYLNEPQ